MWSTVFPEVHNSAQLIHDCWIKWNRSVASHEIKCRTECSLNKLNCRCYRLFLSCTSQSCTPPSQVTAETPFFGLALEICGPSLWRMEGSGRKGKCTGLRLLSLFINTPLTLPLALSSISKTEAFLLHPGSGSWDQFPRLVIFFRSISFPSGCGLLQGNIYSSNNSYHYYDHGGIVHVLAKHLLRASCVLLIFS